MSRMKSRLGRNFKDKDYAYGYLESHVVSRIGAQIQLLRKSRNWTQEKLAKESGIKQEKISFYENAEFNSITLRTLLKLAKAFDISLNVSFTEFSKSIEDIANFGDEILRVVSREADLLRYEHSLHTTVPVAIAAENHSVNIGVPMHSAFCIQSAIEVVQDMRANQNHPYYIGIGVPELKKIRSQNYLIENKNQTNFNAISSNRNISAII